MHLMSRVNWSACLLAIVSFAPGVFNSRVMAEGAGSPPSISKPAPENLADLRFIESQVTAVARKVLPCTVCLRVGPAQASGVVVSPDGYILTAAHVIGRPGRTAQVLFPDGRKVEGKTLGVNPEVDGGLVQITEPGPWPFAEIASPDEAPKPGDWCLATGHPGGYQVGRTPPVRLGRVIDVEKSVIRTDCTISMGDSGGPLFDMQGRVIAIHSRIAEPTSMNFHVPAATYQESWDVLKAGEVVARRISSRFLERLDTNKDGKVSREEIPEGYFREVFDRMASQLALDPQKSYPVEELRKSLGFSAPAGVNPQNLPLPSRMGRPGVSLPPERFAHGRAVRAAFEELVSPSSLCAVRVKCQGEPVAIGTIVSSNGEILTKASQLSDPGKITCVLSGGRELPAQLIGTDPGYDLALLQVEASDLKAVSWEPAVELRPGSWLASPAPAPQPASVGVYSVPARAISRTLPVLGVLIDDDPGGPVIRQVMPNSGAATAGIRQTDRVTHIADELVRNMAELQTQVRKHRVGDMVKVKIDRANEKLEIAVRLGMAEDSFVENPIRAVGALSNRRDDFPAAFQHDTVLSPIDCGGPIVALDGRVIGLNIARADRTGSFALPSDTVAAVLKKLETAAASTRNVSQTPR